MFLTLSDAMRPSMNSVFVRTSSSCTFSREISFSNPSASTDLIFCCPQPIRQPVNSVIMDSNSLFIICMIYGVTALMYLQIYVFWGKESVKSAVFQHFLHFRIVFFIAG